MLMFTVHIRQNEKWMFKKFKKQNTKVEENVTTCKLNKSDTVRIKSKFYNKSIMNFKFP